jgi:hypothetical protein
MKPTKRTFRLFALSLSLGAGLIIAMIIASKEPRYAGRGLSSWLGDLDYGLAGFNQTSVPKAEEAVRQIGSRGVPSLITMMRYRDSTISVRIRKFLAKQKFIKMKAPLSEEHVRWRGARGVYLLGPSAKAAIPELIDLLTNQTAWVRGNAAMALGKIGTNALAAVPALIKTLDDPVPDVRNCTAIGLGSIGPAAIQAAPALVRRFNDPDPETRYIVMGTFLSLTNDRAAVLPYLLRQLSDQVADARGRAAGMLGCFGKDAQAAVPDLRKLLDDPDKNVRRTVTNTLSKIERTAIENTNAPTTSFRFQNASSKLALDVYSSLTGKRIVIAPEILGFPPVTIVSYEPLPVEKAILLIEQELSEQARIVLVPGENGVVVAKYKTNRSR